MNEYDRKVKRWNDYKLDKELAFARLSVDGSLETVEWLKACEREASRRSKLTTFPPFGNIRERV